MVSSIKASAIEELGLQGSLVCGYCVTWLVMLAMFGSASSLFDCLEMDSVQEMPFFFGVACFLIYYLDYREVLRFK